MLASTLYRSATATVTVGARPSRALLAPVRLTFCAGAASGLAVIKTKSSLTTQAIPPRAGGAAIPGSHCRSFAVSMGGARGEVEEVRVTRRLAAAIGLVAGLGPAIAHAQTNIDQGKTPAQIFANDCAACHKPTRALANGKNRFALTEFLREHYTTSREQAAGLAAYVLGAGFGAKPANEPPKSTKTEEETPAAAKQQKPTEEAAKPEEEPAAAEDPNSNPPGRRPAAGRNDRRQANTTATRDRRRGAEPVREDPAGGETPLAEPASTSAAGQAVAEPGEPAAVPRDDIPD
jgi:mono/diheme cytochrome c family protein